MPNDRLKIGRYHACEPCAKRTRRRILRLKHQIDLLQGEGKRKNSPARCASTPSSGASGSRLVLSTDLKVVMKAQAGKTFGASLISFSSTSMAASEVCKSVADALAKSESEEARYRCFVSFIGPHSELYSLSMTRTDTRSKNSSLPENGV